jgi:hypothetical protein
MHTDDGKGKANPWADRRKGEYTDLNIYFTSIQPIQGSGILGYAYVSIGV